MNSIERMGFVLRVIEKYDENGGIDPWTLTLTTRGYKDAAREIVNCWEADIEDERRKLMPDC